MDSSQRPRLTSDVRLRFDRHLQRHVLLDPESGVLLSPSAASIVQLCTGDHTVDDIVSRLSAVEGGNARDEVEREVHAFLSELVDRALVRLDG